MFDAIKKVFLLLCFFSSFAFASHNQTMPKIGVKRPHAAIAQILASAETKSIAEVDAQAAAEPHAKKARNENSGGGASGAMPTAMSANDQEIKKISEYGIRSAAAEPMAVDADDEDEMLDGFLCDYCDKGFEHIKEIEAHVKSHEIELLHYDTQQLCCHICKRGFLNAESLETHNKSEFHKEKIKQTQTPTGGGGASWVSEAYKESKSKAKLLAETAQKVKGGFKCPWNGCSTKIEGSKSRLINHLKIHIKPFVCEQCAKQFAKKKYLTEHIAGHLKKPFQCGMCLMLYKYDSSLQEHKKYCKNGAPSNDVLSEASSAAASARATNTEESVKQQSEFSAASAGTVPMALNTGTDDSNQGAAEFLCTECNKKFSIHIKEEHERFHNAAIGWTCALCKTGHLSESLLVAHYASEYHKQNERNAGISGGGGGASKANAAATSVSDEEIKKFLEDHARLPAIVPMAVDAGANNSNNSAAEFLMSGGGGGAESDLLTTLDDETIRTLAELDNGLRTKATADGIDPIADAYNEIMFDELSAQPKASATVQPKSAGSKEGSQGKAEHLAASAQKFDGGFECPECSKKIKGKKTNLIAHIRNHTQERPFICKICKKGFLLNRHLIDHSAVHTKEKPFHCTICHKQFARNRDLQTHIKKRHDKRVASVNDAASKASSAAASAVLNREESVKQKSELSDASLASDIDVDDEKELTCSKCNKTVDSKEHLEEHMLYHSGTGFKCVACERGFKAQRFLVTHNASKGHKKNITKVQSSGGGDGAPIKYAGLPSITPMIPLAISSEQAAIPSAALMVPVAAPAAIKGADLEALMRDIDDEVAAPNALTIAPLAAAAAMSHAGLDARINAASSASGASDSLVPMADVTSGGLFSPSANDDL